MGKVNTNIKGYNLNKTGKRVNELLDKIDSMATSTELQQAVSELREELSDKTEFEALKNGLNTHKTSVVLDHPDGSVTKAKLSAEIQTNLDTINTHTNQINNINEKIFGTLPVNRGGTGATSFSSGEVLVGNGSDAITTRRISANIMNQSTDLITSGGVYKEITLLSNSKLDCYDFGEYDPSKQTVSVDNTFLPYRIENGMLIEFSVTEGCSSVILPTNFLLMPISLGMGLGDGESINTDISIDYNFQRGHTYIARITFVANTMATRSLAEVVYDNGQDVNQIALEQRITALETSLPNAISEQLQQQIAEEVTQALIEQMGGNTIYYEDTDIEIDDIE